MLDTHFQYDRTEAIERQKQRQLFVPVLATIKKLPFDLMQTMHRIKRKYNHNAFFLAKNQRTRNLSLLKDLFHKLNAFQYQENFMK